jgi:hypothetical protein
MCLFCASKPFGFTAASLTRRSFVSHSLALGSADAILASTLARSEHGRPRLCCKTLAAGTGGEPQ